MNICKNVKILRLAQCFARHFSKTLVKGHGQTFTLEPLVNRELIRVKGPEVVPFLQGLVTNDVARLLPPEGPNSIYAMFLNKGGRVLYDTIIYRTNDPETYLLECDKDASPEFRRHLRTFRVRRKIDIDPVDDEYVPWVIFSENKRCNLDGMTDSPELFIAPDPRLPTLGTRVLAPAGMSWAKLVKSFWRNNESNAIPETENNNYRLMRYRQGVGEGVNELPPGKCFPLEANGDFLNAVSFNKSCYIGQELTARVHHSGVIRKRYMPLRLTSSVNTPHTVKSVAGAKLGTVFGQSKDRAIALLRIEQVINGQQELTVDGERCYAEKPNWWPNDLPHKKRISMLE